MRVHEQEVLAAGLAGAPIPRPCDAEASAVDQPDPPAAPVRIHGSAAVGGAVIDDEDLVRDVGARFRDALGGHVQKAALVQRGQHDAEDGRGGGGHAPYRTSFRIRACASSIRLHASSRV
jgi:hypothetical protein